MPGMMAVRPPFRRGDPAWSPGWSRHRVWGSADQVAGGSAGRGSAGRRATTRSHPYDMGARRRPMRWTVGRESCYTLRPLPRSRSYTPCTVSAGMAGDAWATLTRGAWHGGTRFHDRGAARLPVFAGLAGRVDARVAP